MELSNAMGVYGIVKDGDIIYVGCSINMRSRMLQHLNTLRNGKHHNFLLQRIFDKHGNIFYFVELAQTENREDLHALEQSKINEFFPYCNISDAYGSHPHTEESKKKMREYAKNRTYSHLKKLSDAKRGRPSPMRGIKTLRVPKSAFKTGLIPWNKKYTDEELVEKRKEWNRINGAKYRERHEEELREYKRLKSREYRARKKLEGANA